jgi:HNH endonuclease
MPARLNPETGRGYRFKDRVGQRNGRLVFTRHVGINRHRQQIWEAQCDCGNTARTDKPQVTLSCGCLQREAAAETQRRKALPFEIRQTNRKANALRQRAKRKSNPIVAMQARLSRLHRHALRQVGAIKTSPTFEQLGYSVDVFVAHIERQFHSGMGWHNMSKWQIDHIVPASKARDVADVIALNQLSNLRPMWSKENNIKKAKRVALI